MTCHAYNQPITFQSLFQDLYYFQLSGPDDWMSDNIQFSYVEILVPTPALYTEH
jgi:hypothetical protein